MNWCLILAFLLTRTAMLFAEEEGGRQHRSCKIDSCINENVDGDVVKLSEKIVDHTNQCLSDNFKQQHNENSCLDGKTLNVKKGDVVKVIAPSCKTSETYLPLIKAYIESLGLIANISENIFSNVDPFYSNTDEFRVNDLISALLDDNVKIIWCIRGDVDLGVGSIRLITYLNAKLPATLKQKIFIGYNDITVLHLYFQYKYGWQTIHGLALDDIAAGYYDPFSASVLTTVDLIFERQKKICLPAQRLSHNLNVTRIESKVVGGNSASIELSVKTPWEVNAKGRVLFLEELAENGDHIEKRLDYMKQTRILNGVDAVIFGNFALAESDDLVDFVLDRFAQSVSFPVFRVTGIGHGPINYPLPLLTHCEIKSVDGGVTYEFCVDNIQSTTNDSNSVHSFSKFNVSTLVIIGFNLYLCLIVK